MAHTTKYGNAYTDQEWAEMQAYFKAEKANDDKISTTMSGLEKYLRRQLREEGLGEKAENYVVRLFRYGDYPEAKVNLQFSSESRKTKLDDLWRRWDVAMSKVYSEAMADAGNLEVKRLNIMERE